MSQLQKETDRNVLVADCFRRESHDKENISNPLVFMHLKCGWDEWNAFLCQIPCISMIVPEKTVEEQSNAKETWEGTGIGAPPWYRVATEPQGRPCTIPRS